MNVRILGYGSAHTSPSIGTSFLIGDSVLVDTPPSIAKVFVGRNIDISAIDTILISHLHGDHFFGLPLFLLERRMHHPDTPLRIFGPKNLIGYVMQMLLLGFPENDYSTFLKENNISFYNLEDCDAIETSGLTIRHLQVHHTIEAYGFLFRESGGKTLLYSGDTEYFDELGEKIKEADACLLDATSLDRDIPGHMCFRQLEDFAKQYPDKWFYATHRGGYHAPGSGKLVVPDEANGNVFQL